MYYKSEHTINMYIKFKSAFLIYLSLFILQTNYAQHPYKISFEKESKVIGVGVLTALTGYYFETQPKPLTLNEISNLNKNDINSFDRSAVNFYSKTYNTYSNLMVGAGMSLPLAFTFITETKNDIPVIGIMYIENLLYAFFLPSFTKGGIERIRPYVYNTDVPLSEKLNIDSKASFFSRHTSLAFSSAVFFSSVYSDYFPKSKWRPYIWGGSLMCAGLTGYFRYISGNHFPTDIITGAIVGSVIGYTIPKIHKISAKSNLTVLPSFSENSNMIMFLYRF